MLEGGTCCVAGSSNQSSAWGSLKSFSSICCPNKLLSSSSPSEWTLSDCPGPIALARSGPIPDMFPLPPPSAKIREEARKKANLNGNFVVSVPMIARRSYSKYSSPGKITSLWQFLSFLRQLLLPLLFVACLLHRSINNHSNRDKKFFSVIVFVTVGKVMLRVNLRLWNCKGRT